MSYNNKLLTKGTAIALTVHEHKITILNDAVNRIFET